jgi:glycosyltransferase involved in cell wall biosynthesis
VSRRAPVVAHVAAVEYTATKLLLPQLLDLRERGFDARLFCAPDGAGFDARLDAFSPERLSFPRSARPWPMARATLDLVRLVRRLRPDVVHLHTPAAALPTRMVPRRAFPPDTRIVYTVHGYAHVWDSPSTRDRLLERVERRLAPRTDMLLFQSQEDLTQSADHGYDTRLRYLGNGVEESWFSVPARTAPSRPLELLYVGRLIAEKGLLDLFDALALVPDVRLTLAGSQLPTDRDGVEDELRTRALTPALAGRVTFVGMVEKARLRGLVQDADMMVLPSYREGVPRSMIEGFAAGTPAIATDVRGCRELVTDGLTGLLVPPRDPRALAAALRRAAALTDEEYRSLSRSAAHLASTRYRESTVLDRLAAAYAELGVVPAPSLRSPVVVDDSPGPEPLATVAATQEVHGAGAVGGVRLVGDPVQDPQPPQQQPDDAARGARPGDRPRGVVEAPDELGAHAGDRAGVDLGEPPEELPVPAEGEAGEVVRPGVHLLEERRLGVDDTLGTQDPVDLAHHDVGGEHVLEHGLDDHGVDAAVPQRDRVRVSDQRGRPAGEDVEAEDVRAEGRVVQALRPVADAAPADDEHQAATVGEQAEEPRDAVLRDPVAGFDDASEH